MIVQQIQIVTAGNMANTINSNGIHMNMFNSATIVNGAIQAVFSGSPMGTIKLQISCDNVALPSQGASGPTNSAVGNQAANVVNWADYTGSAQVISGAGTFLWNFFNPGYRWLRLVFIPSGGSSGSLTVNVVLKRTSLG